MQGGVGICQEMLKSWQIGWQIRNRSRPSRLYGSLAPAMGKRTAALKRALNQTDGEREVQRVLKKYPELIYHTLCVPSAISYIIPELALADKYRADFVALTAFSGGWDVHMIELEPPSANLFNEDGTPAARLKKAVTQLDDWWLYTQKHRPLFAEGLREAAMRYGIGPRGEPEEPLCNAGMKITDPMSFLNFRFQVVIGRRETLSPEEVERKSRFRENHRAELLTYDRFLDRADTLERYDKGEAVEFPDNE